MGFGPSPVQTRPINTGKYFAFYYPGPTQTQRGYYYDRIRFYQNPAGLESDLTIGFPIYQNMSVYYFFTIFCLHIYAFAYFCCELDYITVQFICIC